MSGRGEGCKRGRIYDCLKCGKFSGEKKRVVSHIYKYHVPLDEVPFYCSLCHFRCSDAADVKNHLKNYAGHIKKLIDLQKEGVVPEGPGSYIHRNDIPKDISLFYKCRSRAESASRWEERKKPEGSDKGDMTAQPPAHVSSCTLAAATITDPVPPVDTRHVVCEESGKEEVTARPPALVETLIPPPAQFQDQLEDITEQILDFQDMLQSPCPWLMDSPDSVEGMAVVPELEHIEPVQPKPVSPVPVDSAPGTPEPEETEPPVTTHSTQTTNVQDDDDSSSSSSSSDSVEQAIRSLETEVKKSSSQMEKLQNTTITLLQSILDESKTQTALLKTLQWQQRHFSFSGQRNGNASSSCTKRQRTPEKKSHRARSPPQKRRR